MTFEKHRTAPEPIRIACGSEQCPLCKQAVVPRFRPFCSQRCADADLHRWLAGDYRVPTDETPAEPAGEEEEGPPER